MTQFYTERLDTGRSQEEVVSQITQNASKAGWRVLRKKQMKDGTIQLTLKMPETVR